MSGTVNKHVALLSELSKEVKENRLMEVSECEQNLACGLDKDNTISKVQEILSLPNVRPKDALRIVGLFCIRYSHIAERNIDLLCRSVKGNPVTFLAQIYCRGDYLCHIQELHKYSL